MADLKSQQYHIHISAERKWFQLNLKEVWQYRDLIVLFTKRSFKLTFKQTVLGPAWIFINPLITSIIHTLVFGEIAGFGTDGIPKILFYFTSTALWGFFGACINGNAHTFTSNARVFGKVYFPRLTIPISNMFAALIRFGIQMIMVGAFLIYFMIRGEVHPNWAFWPFLPLVVLQMGLMGIGVGIIISSLTTKYRDLSILVGFGVQLWMYATPIVYSLSIVGPSLTRTIMLINPVTMPVEVFRYAFLGKGTIEPLYLVLSIIFSLVVLLIGIMIFNRVEKTFMDTV